MTSRALTTRTFLDRMILFLPAIRVRPVQPALGGERCAVRSRHGQKGAAGWAPLPAGRRRRQHQLPPHRAVRARAVRERAGSSTEGAQGRQQHGQEHVEPRMGFSLHHAEQAPWTTWKRAGFHIGQNKIEPILQRSQWTVLVHGKPTSGPRFPIHPPRRHTELECGPRRGETSC